MQTTVEPQGPPPPLPSRLGGGWRNRRIGLTEALRRHNGSAFVQLLDSVRQLLTAIRTIFV